MKECMLNLCTLNRTMRKSPSQTMRDMAQETIWRRNRSLKHANKTMNHIYC
jgi:hypothetical protein